MGIAAPGESFYSLVLSSSASHWVPSSQALVSATWPILLHHASASSRAGLKCDTLVGAFLNSPGYLVQDTALLSSDTTPRPPCHLHTAL